MISKYFKRIGFGTAAIGRPSYINLNTQKSASFNDVKTFKAEGVMMLKNAAISGITHFDTSSGYGIAEDMLLAFLDEDKPENITISSKWGYTYTANFELNPEKHEVKEHSLKKLNEQWGKSMLMLPYLNLYQIHSVTPDSDVLENNAILYRLFEIKKDFGIDIGITTSGTSQNDVIEKAMEIEVDNEPLFTSFQATFNILDQGLIQMKDKLKNKRIIIKEALANGRIFRNNNYPHYKKLYDDLELLADKYNVGTDAIALRFCMDIFEESMILSGAGTKEQLLQNLKASEFKLSKDEIEKLRKYAIDTNDYWNERKLLEWN